MSKFVVKEGRAVSAPNEKEEGFDVECAWGDGPDVLVTIPRGLPWGVTEVPKGWSFGCSAAKAREIAAAIFKAAKRAEDLEREYSEAMQRDND